MPKPSQLPTTTTPTGNEWVIVVKNGTTYKTTLDTIRQFSMQVYGMTLTSTGSYLGYTDLGWDFTRDLGESSSDGGSDYKYEISTAGGASFDSNIVQTITESVFKTTKIFSGLTPYTTYYARVKTVGGLPGVSNISSQVSNPCGNFSATRSDDGDGTVTITIQTHTPNTGVFIIEEMAGNIRGLVRPVANDQYGKLFIASGEGKVQTTSTGAGGKLVFDAGFPKFYDLYWNNSYKDDMFSVNTPGQWPYMVNAMKYCASNRTTRTNKILYINDAGSTSYGYSTFDNGIAGCASYLGLTMHGLKNSGGTHKEYLTNSDSAATWKSYLMGYDMIVFIGQSSGDKYTLASGFLNGLMDYFDDGGGIFIITDHNSFQHQVNQIVSRYGTEFTSLINRTTGDAAYKVSTILSNTTYLPQGTHPLFADMHPNALIHAGESEGELVYKTSGTDWGKTSSYVSDASGQLTITTHNDASPVGKNKLIVRTANDCGAIFEKM